MSSFFRQNIQAIAGYVPGEQPTTTDWIKLNTNENPYPPSPKVVEAIQKAATGRLNIYPDASATKFREAASKLFGVSPDWILPANGSDENLTILFRSFCDEGSTIAYPYPSYILYETLAKIQNCHVERLKLNPEFQWQPEDARRLASICKMILVPNPNSPTGNRWNADQLAGLCPDNGILVMDEAYGDFPETPHAGELLQEARFAGRTIVTRTLSKSYSLAGLRFGFTIAAPKLTQGMLKVKDSYNCDSIAIAAATAAVLDQDWMQNNRRMIVETRQRLATALTEMGFDVSPSEANFIWATHPSAQHQSIYEQLKARKILIRYMQFAEASTATEGLRISIGSDEEIDRTIEALQQIVAELK
ncbi:UNVERIFIED_CONTAM: hypothetical protein GTU68_055016 [Idotea baltica]|nr:hypothetical protein [Idotea baltica]